VLLIRVSSEPLQQHLRRRSGRRPQQAGEQTAATTTAVSTGPLYPASPPLLFE
jgi:hypothetical protein